MEKCQKPGCHTWLKDSGTDKKTGGRPGGSGDEDVEVHTWLSSIHMVH